MKERKNHCDLYKQNQHSTHCREPYEVYQARLTDEFKENYNLKGILSSKYNELCEKGIKDIPFLSDHIEEWFNIIRSRFFLNLTNKVLDFHVELREAFF